jgi:hypothetical protein
VTATTDVPARSVPAGSTAAPDGDSGHFYTLADGTELWSVTTITDIVDKPALRFWAGNLAAEAAMDRLPWLINAYRTRSCGQTKLALRCGECRDCAQTWVARRHVAKSDEAKDRGKQVHHIVEQIALMNGAEPDYDPELAPFVAQYQRFRADYAPRYALSEAVVFNRTHGYAGTLDAHIVLDGSTRKATKLLERMRLTAPARLLLDAKTTAKDRSTIYPDWALQLAPYRFAEGWLLPDKTEQPLPPVDGAVVLSLRPNGYTLRPVVADETTFAAFLAATVLWRWYREFGKTAVAAGTFTADDSDDEPAPATEAAAAPAARPSSAPKKTTARAVGALPRSRVPGAVLTDDDIPF